MTTEQTSTNRPDRPGDANTQQPDPLPPARLRALVDTFGSAGLANLIGVHASTVQRWASGRHQPHGQAAAQLVALDQVLAPARLVWGPRALLEWMRGNNSYLDGARPIDILRSQGAPPVLEALDAQEWDSTG